MEWFLVVAIVISVGELYFLSLFKPLFVGVVWFRIISGAINFYASVRLKTEFKITEATVALKVRI